MQYRIGDIIVDTSTMEVRRGSEPVRVEPQVFDVIVFLIEQRHKVVTKYELLDAVWGNRFVGESAITSRIRAARQAMGDDGRTQAIIRTTHGKGYRFVGEVTELPAAPEREFEGGNDAPTHQDHRRDADSRGGSAHLTRRPPIKYTESRGHSVAYSAFGDGDETVVLINGFAGNLDIAWESPVITEFYSRLSSFARLIVYDKVGTGVSDRLGPGQLDTLEDRMTDLLAVLDSESVDRATIMGVSEGGPLSVLLAATHPDRVSKLVIFASFAEPPQPEPLEPDDLTDVWGTGAVFAYLSGTPLGSAEMLRLLNEGPQDEESAFYARWERLSCNPSRANELAAITRDSHVREILSAVGVPTLVIHRQGDTITPVEQAHILASEIPSSKLVVLPGHHHLWFAGDPTPVLDEVERFLTGDVDTKVIDRVLATVLFVDIVDSTSTAESFGDTEWTRLLERFYLAADAAVAEGGGELVKTTGDGVLASFDGPARAVRAAGRIRDAARGLGLEVRAGAHTAEVERRGDDLAGIGVHIGARVSALAGTGEVWVSRTVRDLVTGSGLEFADEGIHELKGVTEPWPLYCAQI
ncbi:MAG: alpha/beta fold hydrolase [Acidimicrobiales bacterium]